MDIRNWLKGKSAAKSDPPTPSPTESCQNDSESGENIPVIAGSSSTVPPAPASPASPTAPPPSQTSSPPEDLGADAPNQKRRDKYPSTKFGQKNRSFSSSWFDGRDWLEYSVQTDAVFCFPCRKFRSACSGNVDSDTTFILKGFRNWKHAIESNKGLNKHAVSKEHLMCASIWKERDRRAQIDMEISTLVNSEQLDRNRHYMSCIIEIVEFLASNQLPLRGTLDSFSDMSEGGSGLFLSLFEYTLRKDTKMAKIMSSIPRNATYTSHDIQNQIIEAMSSVVTEAIVKDIGTHWFTIKVDGTRDPTGCENVSIVVRFISEETKQVTERLVTMATTRDADAATLTDTILKELAKVGLNSDKILSQCYDGASVMSGKHGGVQKLLQEKLGREIPYVHCFNHQFHLVIVHALSAEKAISDFFDYCGMLYNFFRKTTVAVNYKGDTLKRLLDQRWTGHLATVSVIIKNRENICAVLSEVKSTRAYGSDVRVEAVGLLNEVKEPHFLFIGHAVQKILLLLDSPNQQLQAEGMDLLTGVKLVRSATVCIRELRNDTVFSELWNTAMNNSKNTPPPPLPPEKRKRTMNRNLAAYVVEQNVGQGQNDINTETEMKRVYYSAIDAVVGEMEARFSERDGKLITALTALDPGDDSFLDATKVKP